jgi:beta-lactamase class A
MRADSSKRFVFAYRLAMGLCVLWWAGCITQDKPMNQSFEKYSLNYDTCVNPELQARLETLDTTLRGRYGMSSEQTAVGLLDLDHSRLALIHPDRIEYAASVAKIGILLAYFQLHPESSRQLSPEARHELGLMIKASSNEMAAKYSREMGLKEIQRVIHDCGLYDQQHGGGLWVGKHYGAGGERIGDPIADHSHAATVRQLLRFYLLLEQGKLVSPAASKVMKEIFDSPEIPHDDIKFVKGLRGRGVQILRKWGSWESWLHDSAIVAGPGRHYILVALIHHPKGDDYLEELARTVDDWMQR